MNISSTKRWAVWSVLLLGAGWVAVFADRSPDAARAVVRPVFSRPLDTARSEVRTAPHAAHAAEVTWLAPIPRTELIRQTPPAPVDLFAAKSWTPPPPPAVVVQMPAAAPIAPPLPFTYAGKMLRAGKWEVYLLKGETALIARQGEIVEDQYLVEEVEPPTMRFKYRPLGQTQSLNIGE